VLIVLGNPFLGGRLMVNAARTAAEADVAIVDDGRAIDDGRVDVGVVDHRGVHVHHRRVVSEDTAAPLAAREADAHVAEAVVHAAVVADVRSPIAFMEDVPSAFPAPIVGRPQQTGPGRGYPCAGNPVVVRIFV
jgi:hypothetical protein